MDSNDRRRLLGLTILLCFVTLSVPVAPARGTVLYANDFSSSTGGLLAADPSPLSLVNSPFTGSQALQIAVPRTLDRNLAAPPNVSLTDAQLAATPVVTQSVRLGLASPVTGTAVHGADAGMEIDDNNLDPVAVMHLAWDPEGTLSFGVPGLVPKHVYLFTVSAGPSNGGPTRFSVFDLSGAAVESAALTAFGDRSMSMSLNYATGEVTYRLDGQVLPFTGTFNPPDGLGYAPLYTFASANAGDVPRAIFDDYAVSSAPAPEPTALALAAVACAALISRRRRPLIATMGFLATPPRRRRPRTIRHTPHWKESNEDHAHVMRHTAADVNRRVGDADRLYL